MTIQKILATPADIYFAHIEALLSLANGQTGKKISLPHGLVAKKTYDSLIFTRDTEISIKSFSYKIPPETPVFIPEINKIITLTATPSLKNKKSIAECVNYDKIQEYGFAELRTRRPGDRINIAGVGTKKLQDYFTDNKIPQEIRDCTPLLAVGNEIIWVLPLNGVPPRVSGKFKTNTYYCTITEDNQ